MVNTLMWVVPLGIVALISGWSLWSFHLIYSGVAKRIPEDITYQTAPPPPQAHRVVSQLVALGFRRLGLFWRWQTIGAPLACGGRAPGWCGQAARKCSPVARLTFRRHRDELVEPKSLVFEMVNCAGPAWLEKEGIVIPFYASRDLVSLVKQLSDERGRAPYWRQIANTVDKMKPEVMARAYAMTRAFIAALDEQANGA